jgi:acetyltransferase-like isoleucine patch superfamily enzyme
MLNHLPVRVRRRLAGYLFYIAKAHSIEFRGHPPLIEGHWPDITNFGKIVFGARCFVRSFRLRPSITALHDASLDIGANTFFNDGVNICASRSITIGAATKIGDMVYIYDSDFHAVSPAGVVKQKPVLIGKNVWIGAHSIVLAGSSIGDHSVIAAGSIVTGEIPTRSVASGNPARVIKTFDAPDDWVRK